MDSLSDTLREFVKGNERLVHLRPLCAPPDDQFDSRVFVAACLAERLTRIAPSLAILNPYKAPWTD